MIYFLSEAASSAVDAGVKTAITNGFGTMTATIKDILIIGVPAAIAVIGLKGGASYGINWVRGLIKRG